ncbi:MAG: hypothetical protein M3301_05915 [Chloroflexota bacterium]|nr:hypothetical protein [Chloroflexota bacterium]
MPQSDAPLGARLTVAFKPLGELATAPASRPLLLADQLTPHTPRDMAPRRVAVTNLTARTLSVRMRATASGPELDELVAIEVEAGGKRVFHGKLRELRRWTARGFTVRGRDTQQIELRAWLPPSASEGYQGRSVELTLEWKPRLVRA